MITALETVTLGYDRTKCYRCVSGLTNFDKTFQIIQTGDCSSSLTSKTITTPLSTHDFVSSGAGRTFNINTFFTQNILPLGCSLSCSIGDTCGNSLTGTEIGQATASTPWTITALETIVLGYDKTACFRCASGSSNFD